MKNKKNYYKERQGLPFNFNQNNYANTKELSPTDWLEQLERRKSISYFIREIKNDVYSLPNLSQDELEEEVKYRANRIIGDDINLILTHGILPKDNTPNEWLDQWEKENKVKLDQSPRDIKSSVKFITRSDACKFHRLLEIDKDEKKLLEKYGYRDQSAFLGFKKPDDPIEKLTHKEFREQSFDFYISLKKSNGDFPKSTPFIEDSGKAIHLVVDLESNDEKILFDLECILSIARDKLYTKKRSKKTAYKRIKEGKFTAQDFIKFSQYKVLSYIDIFLLSELHNVEMTHDWASEIIEGVKISPDALYDKIKPLHELAFTYSFLKNLREYTDSKQSQDSLAKS